MPVQDNFRRIGFFEDFHGYAASTTLSDATVYQYNDISLVPMSGDLTYINIVDETGGVGGFTPDAGNAADGIVLYGAPMIPSSNGKLRMGVRFKGSSATDMRVFCGFQETVSAAEPVNPFTLSGTTLTSNNTGQTVGFYTDTTATTDDFRFHASSDGTELTSAKLVDSIDGSTTLGALGIRAQATITADSWVIMRVEIDVDGGAEGWCGAIGMADQNGLSQIARLKAGNIDKDALYFPIFHFVAASTGSPRAEVDYFWGRGSRDWSY